MNTKTQRASAPAASTATVNSTATVTSGGLVDGVDEESTDALGARLALRLQQPPEGGADHDYEAWALGVTGVTRVWVYRHELGLGTVVVRFVRDNDGKPKEDILDHQDKPRTLITSTPSSIGCRPCLSR